MITFHWLYFMYQCILQREKQLEHVNLNSNSSKWFLVTGVFFNAPREKKNIESKISQSFVKARFNPMCCPYCFWAGNGVSRATPAVFIFHRPAPDNISEMVTSQCLVKECKIQSYAQQVRYDQRGIFLILLLGLDFCFCEGRLLLAVIYKNKRYKETYSYLDPHGVQWN